MEINNAVEWFATEGPISQPVIVSRDRVLFKMWGVRKAMMEVPISEEQYNELRKKDPVVTLELMKNISVGKGRLLNHEELLSLADEIDAAQTH